ncbi:MAG: aldo/keto reductase [bacterium]
MNQVTRRDFLKQGLAGAAVLSGMAAQPLSTRGVAADGLVDQVTLGKSGIQVSRFAMGTGTRGWEQVSDQTKLGQQKFDTLMRHGLDRGINFWDLADIYGSHPYAAKVLKSIPREKLVILSKLWTEPLSWKEKNSPKEDFDRIRREIGTEYLDIVFAHCMTTANWPEEKKEWLDFLSAEKEKGNIRAVGISCHSLDAIKTAAKTPWLDVILARINYKGGEDFRMDASADEVASALKELRAAGKGVMGMKIYGCGTLVKTEEREQSLQFVLKNDLVDAMTIGFLSEAEVDDHMGRVNRILKG